MSGSGWPSLLMWITYVTSSPNSKKFGPPGGYSSGRKLAMIVTESGRSGLTNAYRSVLSATGSLEISGASRWVDMAHLTGAGARTGQGRREGAGSVGRQETARTS